MHQPAQFRQKGSIPQLLRNRPLTWWTCYRAAIGCRQPSLRVNAETAAGNPRDEQCRLRVMHASEDLAATLSCHHHLAILNLPVPQHRQTIDVHTTRKGGRIKDNGMFACFAFAVHKDTTLEMQYVWCRSTARTFDRKTVALAAAWCGVICHVRSRVDSNIL